MLMHRVCVGPSQELRYVQGLVRTRKITETSNILKRIMQGDRVVSSYHQTILMQDDAKNVSAGAWQLLVPSPLVLPPPPPPPAY